MKNVIWSYSKDLRANLPLTIRRVENYTATIKHSDENGQEVIDKLGKHGGYQTELECLKVVLPIAPTKSESSAEFLLNGWLKILNPLISQYEIMGFVSKPKSVNNPDSFIRAIVTSAAYRDKFKEENQ